MSETTESTDTGSKRQRVGLADMRSIIAMLIGIYGVIVLITGFFTSDAELHKADGFNLNVYSGIGMIVVAALFALWARLRPIVVPAQPPEEQPKDDGAGTAH